MGSRRPFLRYAGAAIVSLGAHLSLLLLAVEREPAPAVARAIELEVVHLPPSPVDTSESPPDAAAGLPPTTPKAAPIGGAPAPTHGPPGRRAPLARAPATAEEASPAQPAATPALQGPGDSGGRGASRKPGDPEGPEGFIEGPGDPGPGPLPGEGTHPAGSPAAPDGARRLDLFPDRYDLAASGQPPDGAPAPASPPPSPGVQERLQGLLADDRAVVRGVERVDAYWGEMRRRLESTWQVDEDLLNDGIRRGIGVKLDQALEGWQKQAAAYAATGNPYGEGAMVPGSPTLADYARPLDLPELPAPIHEGAADEGAFRRQRTALIQLVQDETGRVVDVRVQRSSGNMAFDRLAETNARALAQFDLGLPPDGSKSVWSFDATLVITPPLPIAGCAVDAWFIPQHCFYPLSRRVKQAVRLVGVWKADEEPGLR